MNDVLKKLSAIGIVPVVVINDADKAVPLAKALVEGGIPCAEVTFRTAAAEEAIKRMSAEVPELIVGAGTVLTKDQADRAVAAGSKFLVSPGLDPELIAYCQEKNYPPFTPGTANPSDLNHAVNLGLEVVKFFPAEAAGGLKMIKSMAAAFTSLKFMPTGGINAGNLNSYLSYEKIICCGGSWMVPGKLIDEGKFDEIVALSGYSDLAKNILMESYLTTFNFLDFGKGSAMTYIVLFFALLLGIFYLRSLNKEVEY